jgi:hypothetical protein
MSVIGTCFLQKRTHIVLPLPLPMLCAAGSDAVEEDANNDDEEAFLQNLDHSEDDHADKADDGTGDAVPLQPGKRIIDLTRPSNRVRMALSSSSACALSHYPPRTFN